MFNPSVKNTFIVFGMDIPTQKQLMCSPETDRTLVFHVLIVLVF